ncbi:MAG: DUF2516 family protein [Acidimicrobiia bacterium]
MAGPELLLMLFIVGAMAVVPFVLVIWGTVDAANRPDWAWQQAGKNKVLWIVLMVLGLLACTPVGLVSAIVYLVGIRPQVQDQQHRQWPYPGAGPPYAGGTPPGTPPYPGSPPPYPGWPPPPAGPSPYGGPPS